MNRLNTAILAALLSSTAVSAIAQDTSTVTDQIVVRGVNIPDEKRATSEISAVLDEAAFERQGDSNIADALRRVTGLSLSDGKFVIVRGLNERYSSATLNGNPLPSPEPLRRVAPLDLFPTSVLSGSLVQKTFSPEFSGEFGGGAVDLRTKSLPDEGFFEVKGTVGLDTVSTGRDGLTHDGGSTDWLGFDNGARDVPSGIAPFFENGPAISSSNLTDAEQNAIDSTVSLQENWLIFESDTPVNWGLRASGGNTYDVSDALRLGFVATVGTSTEFVTQDGQRRRLTGTNSADGTFNADSGIELDVLSTQQNVDVNGLLSLGAEIYDEHEITITGLILRSSTKETRIEDGLNIEREGIRSEFAQFFERQVWQVQANGEHVFPELLELGVDWRLAYGEAEREAPFNTRVDFRNDENGIRQSFGETAGFDDPQFSFENLDDTNISGGVDFLLPLTIADRGVDLKAGYAYTDKERVTSLRRYALETDSSIVGDLANSRIDILEPLLPTNLVTVRQAQFGLGNPDDFQGDLRVHAVYGGLDAELGDYVRVAAGVRYEDGYQETQTEISTAPGSLFAFEPIDEDYFLPAVTVTWNPVGNIQVRGGFSQTITRPQFREIAPVTFSNPDTDISTFGNTNLVNSEIDNFDVRAEWYFGRGQFVTLGGFYKDISNPIETINGSGLLPGDLGGSTFVNAPEAELLWLRIRIPKEF